MDFVNINMICSSGYYAVPDYQRDYEWTAYQNETLKDDIFAIADSPTSQNHFMGALVTVKYDPSNAVNQSFKNLQNYGINEENIRHIVDGQQRLTSMMIFISELRRFIKDKGPDMNITQTDLNNYDYSLTFLLVNRNFASIKNPVSRLILNGNTGNCFNKEITECSNLPYKGNLKGATRIKKAREIFKTAIYSKYNELEKEGYSISYIQSYFDKLITAVCTRIVFVEIKCNDSTDAFQVFDSLNGKGLDLTAADRIKNIFLSWDKTGKGVEHWNDLEDKIGEDYLTSFFVTLFFYNVASRISKNRLPEQFKVVYKDIAITNFSLFLNSIYEAAELYGKLRRANTGYIKVDSILKKVQLIKSDQIYVAIFAVAYNYKDSNIIGTQSYVDFLNALIKYIVRMQVCQKSMNRLDVVFSECIRNMKNSASLTTITLRISSETKTISDESFRRSFIDFAPSDNNISTYYLGEIEDYLRRKSGGQSSVFTEKTSVEHIIPQSLPKTWFEPGYVLPEEVEDNKKELLIERIGNKALLFQNDNSSAGNSTYQDKETIYINGTPGRLNGNAKNTFKLIEELLDDYPSKFDYESVNNRAEKLADYAIQIW